MEASDFRLLMSQVSELTLSQRKQLLLELEEVEQLKGVRKMLEIPLEDLCCPHCSSKDIASWGQRNNLYRYRCKGCKKTFNSLTSSPLAGMRKKELWETFCDCLHQGLSLNETTERCGIAKTTAIRWRRRFRKGTQLSIGKSS